MTPSTAHKRLKDLAILRLGQAFPGRLRLWSQSAGEAFPRATVSGAFAWFFAGPLTLARMKQAIARMKPLTMGVPGMGDASGAVMVELPDGRRIGWRLEVEIKIEDDPQRESQEDFEAMCERLGIIYLLIRGDRAGANHEAVCKEAAQQLYRRVMGVPSVSALERDA